ncbi:MAG: AAA family ATPase [Verrucomicrobiales bacterium]|nr:AAA family ATPase [Verrucomicrobiales bacterium]
MTITVPVYVERIPAAQPPRYWAASLFVERFDRIHTREDKALSTLESDLRRHVSKAATAMRHDDIAYWAYSPNLTSHRLRLHIPLRRHAATCDFFFATWEALGRRLVLSPRLPNLVFEWPKDVPLEVRATEVLVAYFREREREGDERNARPEDFSAGSGSRLTYLKITTHATQRFKEERDRSLAHLGGDEKMSGAEELERVGRCLNRRYPNDLAHAILRDHDVDELLTLFADTKKPPSPVVLVGPPQVGKSAVVQEFLHRRLDAPSGRPKPELWLISPQRVISGMSFVGQWEERFHAILKHATERRHTLYFNDVLGLFQAGRSRDSDLSIGHLLKAHLEENPLAILSEATPEAWARLREIDRPFCDLFHTIHLREPSTPDTLRVLVRFIQDVEARHRCAFTPATIPLVVALQRRFVRARAFPGKAAELLEHVAATRPGETIDSEHIYAHFASRTGINPLFLDTSQPLQPATVRSFFAERIMGQTEAVEAMVSAVLMSKARLNDPARPVASLLYLGPTGVGKTECAKALAEFFFGSTDKMVRFDMNEFVGPDAVMRLIGSFGRPAGQLTGAVRRNPYTVILLDEIEKANPDVFDLLLQLLGDGRLTDANGITTDFCNTIIILTSNLGARSVRQTVGFGASSSPSPDAYREAAENFFRPELFNRLDRVIAFHELTRDHITALAARLVSAAVSRHGLRDRHITVHVDPSVHDFLARRGFVPEHGARALRRAVEDHLVTPLSDTITAPDTPQTSVLHVRAEDGQITVDPHLYPQAQRRTPFPEDLDLGLTAATEVSGQVTTTLREIDTRLDSWQLDDDDPRKPYYYLLREERHQLRQKRDQLISLIEATRRNPKRRNSLPKTQIRYIGDNTLSGLLETLLTSTDPQAAVRTVADGATLPSPLSRDSIALAQGVNRLAFLADLSFAEPQDFTLTIPHQPLQTELQQALTDHAISAQLDLLDGTHVFVAGDGASRYVHLRQPDQPVTHLHTSTHTVDFLNGIVISAPGTHVATTLLHLYPSV